MAFGGLAGYNDAVHIRPATIDDAAAIAEIYNREVTGSTVTFDLVERDVEGQRAWIADRSGAFAVVVAVSDAQEVMGFASLSPYKDRPAYRTTVEDSLYVHHDHRGAGVGRAMLSAILDVAREHGFHAVMARIVTEGTASIRLHQSLGFEPVGVEREVGRKFSRWLDVQVMQNLL